MLGLSYFYTAKDKTKLYLTKLVQDFIKDYKKNKDQIYKSQCFFLKVVLIKDYIINIKIKDMLKELKVKIAQKGKKVIIKDVLKGHQAYKNSLLKTTIYMIACINTSKPKLVDCYLVKILS